jgi:dTDP-glucose pyrophosphorylase
MSLWRNALTKPGDTVRETIRRIDGSSTQIALVVDADGRLLGTITDGDIRRGLLKGVSLDDPASAIMNASPTCARPDESREVILARMKAKSLHQIPVVDTERRVVGLEVLDELLAARRDNWVVLMAGGRGTRLRPLTDETPKPLLRVGAKPILETILGSFIEQGFSRFFLAVNYRADMVRSHFGDGSRWGVEIGYLSEQSPLGTAGALSLLPSRPASPLLVMNADLLTRVGFGHMLDFHRAQGAVATMGVREYDFQVPFGVVKIKGQSILSIEEKPTHRFFVNAGIYVLSPETLDLVPQGRHFDMPELFEALIAKGRETAVFPVREYWIDIGRMDDFEKAADGLHNS